MDEQNQVPQEGRSQAAGGNMKSIERGFGELEQIARSLESGQLPIDEAIAAYSRGMELALECKRTLDNLAQQITVARERAEAAMQETGGVLDAPAPEL